MNSNDKRNNKDRLIAAAVTALVALLVALYLIFGSLVYDSTLLRMTPEARVATLQEDELFIEPEILEDQTKGEPDAVADDEPAPLYKGIPEKAEEENTRVVEPGKSKKPAPPEPKPITQKTESPVKHQENTQTDEARQKATSALAGKFKGRNGNKNGSTSSGGAGGSGVGVAGNVHGRNFIGCDAPVVSVKHQVTVVVDVTINAAGRVTTAKARRGGGADAATLRKCEQAALRTARWSSDPDTPSAKGTLTFKIRPKV